MTTDSKAVCGGGEAVTLAECPVGLFVSESGTLGLKTEYHGVGGATDCYIVETGEFFWGSGSGTPAGQAAQRVRPIPYAVAAALASTADDGGETYRVGNRVPRHVYRNGAPLFTADTDELARTVVAEGNAGVAALASTARAAAGDWVTVPRAASKAMLDAAYAAHDAYEAAPEPKGWGGLGSVYKAMIEAAPAVPASPRSGAGDAARVCHDEQMTVWTGEIAGNLSMGGYLREDLSYDDRLAVDAAIASDLRSIIESAFTHPELSQADTAGRPEPAVEIRELSEKATPGPWKADYDGFVPKDQETRVNIGACLPCINGLSAWFSIAAVPMPDEAEEGMSDGARNRQRAYDDAAFIVALVNAWRAGDLIHVSALSQGGQAGGSEKGKGEEEGRVTSSPGSREPSPAVSASGFDPSRDGWVDWDELNRLFAGIPEGPWYDSKSTGGHEIRQIDTDPTNKHHWPFRLCQSISGQRAGCDDAVFAFIAGVLNAWPQIAATVSEEAEIQRIIEMPEDELRKRSLANGRCPEQEAQLSRWVFEAAKLRVALTQISSQYVENRGDMTDAEALTAIKVIADRAISVAGPTLISEKSR